MSEYGKNPEGNLKVGTKVTVNNINDGRHGESGVVVGEVEPSSHPKLSHLGSLIKVKHHDNHIGWYSKNNLKLNEDVPATSIANAPHTQTEPVVSKDNAYKKRNKTLKKLRDDCSVKESKLKD